MLRKNMRSIYRKWAILALLLGGVYFVGYSDQFTRDVGAAPCVEECEDNRAMARDACNDLCVDSSTSADCNTCIMSSNSTYLSCLSNAVWCNQGYSYSPNCTVQYGSHCPIIGGQPNCGDPSAYNAYFLLCTQGGNQCVSCPGYRYCSGSGGAGPCVPY